MCGICGIFSLKCSEECIEQMLETGIKNLKHRGYDGYGVTISKCDTVGSQDNAETQFTRRRTSLLTTALNDSFTSMKESYPSIHSSIHSDVDYKSFNFDGNSTYMSIGHTRYRTKGACSIENAQPLFNASNDIAIVHNGQVECGNNINEGSSDTRYILNVFEKYYQLTGSVTKGVSAVIDCVKGSYACILMIKGEGLIAFRDPKGIRPLCIGVKCSEDYPSDTTSIIVKQLEMSLFNSSLIRKEVPEVSERVVFSSESVVIDALGCSFVRDVKPGEIIWVHTNGVIESFNISDTTRSPCLFEFIYLADKRSVIDGINVGEARTKMGELMASSMKYRNIKPHLIIPIPSTPNEASKTIADLLGVFYSELIHIPALEDGIDIKTSRTFILPTKACRENAVKRKFSINNENLSSLYKLTKWRDLRNIHVALVDDSIVRGTTMSRIIDLVKTHLCPKEITIISLAPPVRFENRYGIDIPDRETLIAHNRNVYDIARYFGVHRVLYNDLTSIVSVLSSMAAANKVKLDGMETSVFSLNVE